MPIAQHQHRPLRQDAERNRIRVLEAAAELFAAHGTGVSTAQIAELAGVGNGTIFRRYPTKGDLVAAVIASRVDQMTAVIDAGIAHDDPWLGFAQFMHGAIELHVHNRALFGAVMGEFGDHAGVQEVLASVRARTALILERCQQAGIVRSDVEAHDLIMIMCAIASTDSRQSCTSVDAHHRYVRIMLDGLRAGAHCTMST
ncbi:MAG: TetR/AcrR family transcriptional regulator [Thermoleophilia bacterium]|nr:TetR/AcrR family transcriptional regulator [Thermoleophilia bacterium]